MSYLERHTKPFRPHNVGSQAPDPGNATRQMWCAPLWPFLAWMRPILARIRSFPKFVVHWLWKFSVRWRSPGESSDYKGTEKSFVVFFSLFVCRYFCLSGLGVVFPGFGPQIRTQHAVSFCILKFLFEVWCVKFKPCLSFLLFLFRVPSVVSFFPN